MTPETTSALAALNQALEAKDAEIAALKAELATVTTWKAQAIDAMLNFRYDDMVRLVMAELKKDDAPATVRGEVDAALS